jgi:hypothetical protein
MRRYPYHILFTKPRTLDGLDLRLGAPNSIKTRIGLQIGSIGILTGSVSSALSARGKVISSDQFHVIWKYRSVE